MNSQMLSRIADAQVQAVLKNLPGEVRSALANVPVFLEWQPAPDDASDILGFFDPGPPEAPTPRIRLWIRNLWEYSERNEAVFREEIRTTLLHEIGHAVGLDEGDVERRGLG